jgi:hypothetical protein
MSVRLQISKNFAASPRARKGMMGAISSRRLIACAQIRWSHPSRGPAIFAIVKSVLRKAAGPPPSPGRIQGTFEALHGYVLFMHGS